MEVLCYSKNSRKIITRERNEKKKWKKKLKKTREKAKEWKKVN